MFSARNHTCCFTGHRVIEEAHRAQLPALLEQAIRELILEEYYLFATGGALGFDTLAAETVLALQQEFPHLRLIVVAPYAGQADGWDEADRLRYERIREAASDYRCLSAAYSPDCMRRRNRALVEMSAACISYCLRDRTGSSQTVGFARREGLLVIPLAERLGPAGEPPCAAGNLALFSGQTGRYML